MSRKKSLDMTEGPFLKKIFIFAVPLMLTGILQLVYNTADVVVVGRFAGKEALAAVGATGSLINLILNIFIGLSMGSGVMAARYIGAKNDEKVSRCVHTAMLLSVICGIFVAVFGFFMSRTFLEMMKSPEDVIDLASLYLKIYFLGAPGSLVYNFGASLVRATGDTKRPLYILFVSGLVNIVLNLLLVVVFKMGVSGVAIATIVSQYISAVIITVRLTRLENSYRLKIRRLHIYKDEFLKILYIGLPSGVQGALFSISNVIIQSTVNTFGSAAMAGIAAGSNYDSYIYTCTNAVSQTTMTFSSQNLGAGKYSNMSRVFRYCLAITVVISAVLCSIGYIFSPQIVNLFSTDSSVIDVGVQRMTMIMPFFCFCSLQDVAAGQLRGMGKSVEPMILSLLGACGIRLLWIFVFLPMNPTLIYLYWAYPLSWAITFVALILFYLFINNRMKKKTLQ